jgi:hypothetical protein
VIALNTLVPGAGLAAGGRPLIEVVLGVMFSQASLLITGGIENVAFLVPIMAFGGVWASLHTPYNPVELAAGGPRSRTVGGPVVSTRQGPAQQTPSPTPPSPQEHDSETEVEEAGYSVEVGCTECGAGVEVPVFAHMARCSFCGSEHLVVGHHEILYVTVPERVRDAEGVRQAVLDHYRYQHYLKLYKKSVTPLERSATEPTTSGVISTRPEASAAIAAAEAAISKKADLYRARLAETLRLVETRQFLAPYRHGMGTLYQAAFGRNPQDQEKRLEFAVGVVEAATVATDAAELPKMGRLSYLRALVPAAQCPPDIVSLPLTGDDGALERAFGNLDRKQLVRDLNVIRLGVRFVREITAVVWRPWWIADVEAPGIRESLLVDGAAASVAGPAPHLDPTILGDLPEAARAPGGGLRFVPMQCPICGQEFSFDTDAVLHFCSNCHRVCGVEEERNFEVPYVHQPGPHDPQWDLGPFWYFPLRIRTGGGALLSDFMHFKDGIDGTLDQIGVDAELHQHSVLVPAFRCINMRLMAGAFHRLLLHTLRRPPRLSGRRIPVADDASPWSVSLAESEARDLLPLYLANAFGRRDMARVNVHQVTEWLFEATQESPGTLAYVPIPRPVTEPFRSYLGRYRSQAVRHVRGHTAGDA